MLPCEKDQIQLFVGVVLFSHEEESFREAVLAIKKSFGILREKYESQLTLMVKWNSPENFNVSDLCRSIDVDVIVISNTFNVGFGKAHNLMMKKALEKKTDSFYLCLNPDGFIHPNCLLNLVYFYNELEKPALVEAIQFPKEHPKPYDPFTGLTSWCSGACLLISSYVYATIGGFDDQIFMYCEDIDYSWRCRRFGLECYTCNSALFFHDVSEQKSPLIKKLMLESARYLAFKWSAPEFQAEIERQLIESSFYPTKDYLPRIKEVKERFHSDEAQEWRQLLSFSVPRW